MPIQVLDMSAFIRYNGNNYLQYSGTWDREKEGKDEQAQVNDCIYGILNYYHPVRKCGAEDSRCRNAYQYLVTQLSPR